MTFTRSHHQVIAVALGCLDAAALAGHGCLFAGGTALAMRFGEYRESVDIDFVIADPDAYRGLRTACRRDALDALAVPGQRAVIAEVMTIDQYGIRTRLDVAGVPVKLKLIREARITLDAPGRGDRVLGLATATVTDLVAMKLLANSDRWADPTVFSRDILDLAMVAPRRPLLASAAEKAIDAYGLDVLRDAHKALDALLDNPRRLQRCLDALSMVQPRAQVSDRLRRLAASLNTCAGEP